MVNRLAGENSPYLLQHKDNPVDWYPWGEEALNIAKEEDKPIFLSIGYSACHWCHVMEHESFEDEDTAKIMNEHFINIKVDREERPDIDKIYMNAVVAITGQGGWPMSVFLTPGGEPFFGGTYYPPVSRYGMPSFKDVLKSVVNAWKQKREEVIKSGDQLTDHIRQSFELSHERKSVDKDILDKAAMALAQTYDWKNGGWGKAPKFPQAMAIRFLLMRASRGDKMALDITTHALRSMAKGGMYDVLGGGFARYSVDDFWLVPHFEKMLYDNALLTRVYLHAYMLTKDPFFRRICEETLDFIIREMTHEMGGFYSSLDADTEGEEGKFYLWTLEEIKNIIGDEKDLNLFILAYGITEKGNFEGETILQRVMEDEQIASKLKIDKKNITKELSRMNKLLFEEREKRIPPFIDNKILISWNAWMSIAFSEAARYLQRDDYLDIAKINTRFLLNSLIPNGRLMRSWRDGKAQHNAYLEDYASLILALLSIYQSAPMSFWFQSATELTHEMIDNFSDPTGGFFDTRIDHENLLARPKEIQDNATPSGNSLAAEALLFMAGYTGNGEWIDKVEAGIGVVQDYLKKYPTSFGNWLCAMDFAFGDIQEIAIVGELDDSATQSLISTIWEEFRPYSLTAIAPFPPPEGSPPLLNDRPIIHGKPSAYVCRNMVCQQPTTSPKEFRKLLSNEHQSKMSETGQ
jgi:uncharacterized protein YyaL (SSP411 family)